jgi:hypothetical protein
MITVRLDDQPGIAPERSGVNWSTADSWLPDRPICVLAWDGEAHFIAVYESEKWWNAHLDEEIDSVITHWCHLPEPEEAA